MNGVTYLQEVHMFRKREPAPSNIVGNTLVDDALDTLGGLLSVWAKHPISIAGIDGEETKKAILAWRANLITGAPSPAATREQPVIGRDWAGARHALRAIRERESGAIDATYCEFRDALWNVMHTVLQVYASDKELDNGLIGELDRLSDLRHSTDPSTFRERAMDVVGRVRTQLEARESKRSAVIHALGTRLESVKDQLQEARGQMVLDPLTQVLNRAGLDQELTRLVRVGTLVLQPATLLMIDVDHFKEVNDEHGHPVGDEVLVEIARRLVRTFPRKRDMVARYGGEEFAVTLGDTDMVTSERLALRLLDTISDAPFPTAAGPLEITVSLGVATLNLPETEVAWLKRADVALYEAKRAGRNRYRAAG
ncbi:MAG: diguanylate cyclase (GGDEF)-like protein [Bradymonadia bacterium]|jgi:diguanylate cyclase (GGDEF)-like protein